MINKLFKVWIGLVALSGIMIFLHNQELKKESQADLFIQNQMQKMEELNPSLQCNIFKNENKFCNHSFCQTISANQIENDLEVRP